ncbi:hypothetical protein MRB53_028011 [Persea americana]|uniref:Uncharacterized protein n=1 Tax=Persea americana TaxID=3435 RepID=A0ACC2KEB6_PERAE|nr:hypothetical protein MRB53_028011 [Persea americana]
MSIDTSSLPSSLIGTKRGRLALRTEEPSREGGTGTEPRYAYGCAARAGEGTELRTVGPLNRGAEPRGWHRAQDGWPSEQRRRAARVVPLPDPDMLMAVPPELVKAPSSGRAGEGTELRTVGPLNRGAEPRGWYCYRTLICLWLCRQSW